MQKGWEKQSKISFLYAHEQKEASSGEERGGIVNICVAERSETRTPTTSLAFSHQLPSTRSTRTPDRHALGKDQTAISSVSWSLCRLSTVPSRFCSYLVSKWCPTKNCSSCHPSLASCPSCEVCSAPAALSRQLELSSAYST